MNAPRSPIPKTKFPLLLALGALLTLTASAAGHKAAVREYERAFTTYPYSDPNPVPAMSRFYPYFRYDGFTDAPVQRKWKVVELSNDYLQVLILPEIGGKIWTAIDKTTGKPFIYFNHVVKFRDVSMRGPWTSGGIEANYGIIGHTPNCFSPVDYLARRNADGSVSCFIGVLDLLTRSTWRVEINLPPDAACFTTRSWWHNGSAQDQPYYTWMNAGLKASGNLEFISPGTRYIGHNGESAPWPFAPENGHNLAWYNQNDFGSYKSYHEVGRLAEFFGGYWHDEDFGMAHYASFADKPGRKIWIWGLSREGMIWEKLLTDTDGQYVEMQSGRLFNQAAEGSSRTPFKHREFPPYGTDTWNEYWFPVKGTGGYVTASPWGALNVVQETGKLLVRISPVRAWRDTVKVYDGERLLFQKELRFRPMQPVQAAFDLKSPIKAIRVTLGGDKLVYAPAREEALSRPVTPPAAFDWNSAYGRYLKGKENARQRAYSNAAQEFEASLKLEPNFVPALVELAALANRRADWTAATNLALNALSVDTYDPAANYQFGIASAALGHNADAQDGFSIAALSPAWRSAASVELAKAFLREHRYERALASAQAALDADTGNADALQLRASICRLRGDPSGADAASATLLRLDPLNHFVPFEKYLRGKATPQDLSAVIRNELPHESYLELAAWYHSAGLAQDAAKVLEQAPPTAEVLYWLAWLTRDTNQLTRAEAASPEFVFPFRWESLGVFEWAASQQPAWQPKYYLALLRWHLGQVQQARELLNQCGQQPRFAPFYAARAQLCETNAASDLRTAAQLDPAQWRYGAMLARLYLNQPRGVGTSSSPQAPPQTSPPSQANPSAASALSITTDFTRRFPHNSVLALLHAKALLANSEFSATAQLLNTLSLLPCEGSTEARSLFREANLMVAVQHLQAGAVSEARDSIQRARQWPERLGAGKPYPNVVDERLEDWLEYQCALQSNDEAQASSQLAHLLGWEPNSPSRNAGQVIRALALKASRHAPEGERELQDWLKANPQDPLPKWGLEVFEGRSAPLPPEASHDTLRVLAAWAETQRK